MGRDSVRLYLNRKQATAWKQDIAALQHILGITSESSLVRTVMHLAAKMAHKLIVWADAPPNVYRTALPSTGETVLIYPGPANTWIAQIGDDPLNTVERLDSPDAAIRLVMNAN